MTALLCFGCFYLGALIGVALMCLLQINRPDSPATLRPDAPGPVRIHLQKEEN